MINFSHMKLQYKPYVDYIQGHLNNSLGPRRTWKKL